MKRYNNYHKHSHFSSLFGGVGDSNVKQNEYIDRCLELGHTNFFTTEHGVFGDIFEAFDLSHNNNLRCLPGLEGYVVVDNNPELKDKSNYHIMILPKTDKARKKCNYYNSLAHINGFYYKPRWSLNYLLSFDKDELFITTACCAGLLADEDGIEKILMPLINHFGDNVLLEVQNHNVDIQRDINKKAVALADTMGLSLVAANDSHYIYPWQAQERHDLMVGKRQLDKKTDSNIIAEDEFILDFPDYDTFFKRFEKQGVLTEQQIESAIDNTLIFDSMEEIQLDYNIKMPNIYPSIPLDDRMKMLEDLVWAKFEETKQKEHISDEDLPRYIDGINYELQIIRDTNEEIHTCDYFLFNTRNVDLAVNEYNGILTRGGRGSCASFYINKLLGMTQLDRFKINLPIFPDRFASTARLLDNRALPDIDFNVEEQQPFVKASKELLGENGCFPMVAYGTMQEGEAFRNVCRSHGLNFDEFNDVAKNLDEYRLDKKWKPLIEEAEHYVGTIVSASVHPCAHILSDKDLMYEYGVVKVGDFNCVMITSGEADQFKVLKNDYLIVSVWKLIHETFEEIGIPIIDAHDLLDNIKDDQRVWDLFKNGITCTLNQVDSENGMQQAKKYGIKSFEDGALIAAAIRPSFDAWRPKFLNHDWYSTGSKDLDKVLEQTQHYILFQENLMQYFDWLGVTPAESIGLIKKISKKKIKTEDFEKLEERLRGNWIKQTGSISMFNETWKMIQGCMAYGFASPHAAATSLDMCYGAYLKVNYPYEYYTVCFNNYADDAEKTAKLKRELSYFGINLSGIKFGMSRARYSYDKDKHLITKGIGSIKFLNETVAEELYTLSQSRAYDNFIDLLMDITEKTSCNSRQLGILIKLDYFSDYGEPNSLTYIYEQFAKLWVKGKGFRKSIKGEKAGVLKDVLGDYCETYTPKVVKAVDVCAIQTELSNHESKLQEFNDILQQCIKHKKDGTENGINYEKLFKLTEMPEDIKFRFATKISDEEFKEIDGYGVLSNLSYRGAPMSVKEKIKAQQEYLSYIDYTDASIDKRYVVVTNLNTNYSPKFVAYCINNGKTVAMKVRKNKRGRDYNVVNTFKDTPFEDGDILYMIKCKQEPKAIRQEDGSWGRDYSNKEWWLYEYFVKE